MENSTNIIEKLKRKLYRWDLEAYICFRKRPTANVNFHLPTALASEGWRTREVDFSAPDDIEKITSLFLEAFPNYKTTAGARAEIKNGIKKGDLCFVLANQERFAAMIWMGFENNRVMQSVGMFIDKQKKAAVPHRAYISPDIRGFGIQRVINNQLTLKANSLDIQWIHSFVGVKNIASVNNCMKVYEESRLVYHLTIEAPFIKKNYFPKINQEHWKAT